ncbi:MAG: hypothetical protein RBG13Loki_2076 [Promethearchaeota archaeon CR_4]|nr:MAG: hypothetical protein RBG13Loki_2076 [Candidatus Lokiarchaeota archaeon CR_4]
MVFTSFDWMMVAVYAGVVVFGYVIASRQIKLVKGKEFSLKDYVKSLAFGLLFSAGVSFIIGLMIAVGSLGEAPLAEFQPFLLLIILLFITVYPLVDLLYLAHGEKSERQTPYHTMLANLIFKRASPPRSYIIAVFMYLILFIAPILVLIMITGLPPIIIWISWIVVIPIIVLSYYATRGFVSGIMRFYFHIPAIGRSAFLSFGNGSRVMSDFKENPMARIGFGFLLFTFVWQFISLYQTLAYIIEGRLVVNPASYTLMALLVLFFGISGFFSRFWGRKIKFRTMDFLLSGWMMATIGANVLINFSIANQDALFRTFSSNPFFLPLVSGPSLESFKALISPLLLGINRNLSYAAAIEEIVLIIVISYYFRSKKNPFTRNTLNARITLARQAFDPIVLFNCIRTSYSETNKLAEQALVEVYERLPLKKPHVFAGKYYLHPVLDAMCDPNRNVRRVGQKIFADLVKAAPEQIMPWVIHALQSPNYDKRLPAAESLLGIADEHLGKIPPHLISDLVKDSNWQAREIGYKICARLATVNPKMLNLTQVEVGLDDGDYGVQAGALLVLAQNGVIGESNLVLPKLSHPSDTVRRAAALAVGKIGLDKVDAKAAPILIEMMQSSSGGSRIAAFEAIQKIGKISEFHIPIEPIVKGLFDSDANVQIAATKALMVVCDTEPYKVNVNYLISQYNSGSSREKLAILPILGKLWKDFPNKILPIIFASIPESEVEIKNLGMSIAREIGKFEPAQVVQQLIRIPDKGGLVMKSVVSRTLIDVGKGNPNIVIPLLNAGMLSEDPAQRYNSASVLEVIGPEFPDLVDFSMLSAAYIRSGDAKEKKQIAKILSEVIQKNPRKAEQGIQVLVEGLKDKDQSVRISMAKTLQRVSETAPEIVPVQVVKDHLKDPDPLVREAMLRILGDIGKRLPDQAIIILLDALGAEDWIFRNAAADGLISLAKVGASQKIVIDNLVRRLNDPDKWVRYKILLAISGMLEKNPDAMSMDVLVKLLSDPDEKVRETAIKAIGKVGASRFAETHTNLRPFMRDASQNIRDATVSAYFDLSSKVDISTMLDKLLQLLGDEVDLSTQRTVALILRRVAKYEKTEIRTRIIKLLRIRCEMSQDDTICRVLSEFEHG